MYSDSNLAKVQNFLGGVGYVLANAGNRNYGLNKGAYSFADNDFSYVTNGGSVNSTPSGTLGLKSLLTIGRGADYSTDLINDHVQSFKYYPSRTPATQLQLMTQ